MLSALVDALLASKTFEDASTAVLEPMLAVAEKALAESRYGSQGKMLRAMVHLRPDDGYRGIAVLERPATRAVLVGNAAHPSRLPSANAWRWVSEDGSSVAIDVNLGRVEPMGAGTNVTDRRRPNQPGQTLGRESAARLLERSSTHLFAVPLTTPGGIVGMVSLEADCRPAMGRPFIWADQAKLWRDLAFVAAPYLNSRPLGSPGRIETDPLLPVVGASMRPIVHMARVFAQQDETLLITGPTGAGKSRFARYCHAQSSRCKGPFEGIDLLSIPDELQMGELFGWRKGAFSGAINDNPGALARAEGGTLFIDEIDKLTLKAQAGLLHVLEERRYRPLGEGSGERKADVRFVVGTNANLIAAVKEGRFREDLYYRINVLPLRLPPLDERADEIRLWADFMVMRRHQENKLGGAVHVAAAAWAPLEKRSWPGNLRQLDNVLRRAYAFALVDRTDASGPVHLDEPQVARALTYETTGTKEMAASASVTNPPLPEAMLHAARAFVHEAEQRLEKNTPLDLDLAEALRGFVLGTAVQKTGGLDAAFKLVGKGAAVEHRNHKKMYRREVEKVAEFYREAGAGQTSPFDVDVDEK